MGVPGARSGNGRAVVVTVFVVPEGHMSGCRGAMPFGFEVTFEFGGTCDFC